MSISNLLSIIRFSEYKNKYGVFSGHAPLSRNQGKVYSGRGISTDIVGASIHAYLSALNKIVYEEDNV